MSKYYTGVGHRLKNVEPGVEKFIVWLAGEMAERGYTLISGAADGIDEFFERGSAGDNLIYLPRKGFGKVYPTSNRVLLTDLEKDYADHALEACHILPEITEMSPHNKKYHQRNYFQSWNNGYLPDACFYYAKESDEVIEGGTRTAVYTARYLKVPDYNLYTQEGRDKVVKLLERGKWG